MGSFCLGIAQLDGISLQLVFGLPFCTLNVKHAGDHTAANLHKYFTKLFANYGISAKVICGTTDNGANYVAALKEPLNTKWESFRCIVHTLQLCVMKALKVSLVFSTLVPFSVVYSQEFGPLMTKIRTLVKGFRKSGKANKSLFAQQKFFGLPEKQLSIDSETRWNRYPIFKGFFCVGLDAFSDFSSRIHLNVSYLQLP